MVTDCFKTKQTRHRATYKVKVYFGWKIWLLSSCFFNGKAFTLNKTNKTDIVEWNFQAVTKPGKLTVSANRQI
jgi:hypothetical protein